MYFGLLSRAFLPGAYFFGRATRVGSLAAPRSYPVFLPGSGITTIPAQKNGYPRRVAHYPRGCYNMCMHIEKCSADDIIDSVSEMDEQELDRLQAAIDRRRGVLKKKQSPVLERREYRNGVLQLEGRAYRRKKDGGLTERGPYWYFHYREGGKQRTLYLGKADNPEAKVDEVMKGEE